MIGNALTPGVIIQRDRNAIVSIFTLATYQMVGYLNRKLKF